MQCVNNYLGNFLYTDTLNFMIFLWEIETSNNRRTHEPTFSPTISNFNFFFLHLIGVNIQ